MDSLTPFAWYQSEQDRLQNTRTKVVQAYYEFIREQFFLVELNQIVDLLARYKSPLRFSSTRLFPLYVPVAIDLLAALESTTGEAVKIPRVKVSYGSRLLVLSKETVSEPLKTLDDCIRVMNNFKVVNLVQTSKHQFGEVEIYQKMFKIAARVLQSYCN